MGIREEIEKLREATKQIPDFYMEDDPHLSSRREYFWMRDQGRYFDALDDVLSILDEHLGELVADEEARKLIPVRLSDMVKKNIRPGDHISIYVRRDESH